MSHLYYWFRQLDWDNFTSDASTPLKDVKLLLKGVRKEFKDIAAKDLWTITVSGINGDKSDLNSS